MLTERLIEVVNNLNDLMKDSSKADKGNKAAARRVRVAVQNARKLLQEVRNLSLDKDEKPEEQVGE